MNETKELTTTNPVTENGEQNIGKGDFFIHTEAIGDIAHQAGGINDLFFEFAGPHLEFFCVHLSISLMEAAIYAMLVRLYNGGRIPVDRLQNLFSGKIILSYMNELENLEEKNLIHINRECSDYRRDGNDMAFVLRLDTIDSIRKGDYCKLVSAQNLSIDEFFAQLARFCQDRVEKRQLYRNTKNAIKRLLCDNEHLVFVQKIQTLFLSDDDTLMLLRIFVYTVVSDSPEIDCHCLSRVYENPSDFSPIRRQLKCGNHILLTKGLIENTCGDGFSEADTFRLTDAAKEEFLIELDEAMQNIPIKGLKPCNSIAVKNLFYPEKTQAAINELASLLQPEHFNDVQQRLSENGMRTGFACLFSGGPGTGKTETANQIARMTGRDLMCVDIAAAKSKWFGESEKQIKAVFDKYRSCVKKSKVAPILLFNEADAIFGKRQQLGETRNGPAQTENTIQNIILQECENLNGILIATTNLSNNMDAAFERRFLYKIEFEKPGVETRTEIWCSMINGLTTDAARTLASRYEFSGGQIENIARKSTVHRVLSGKTPVLDDMFRFCAEESLNNENAKRIGFAV